MIGNITSDVYAYKQERSIYAKYPYSPEKIYPEFKDFTLYSMDCQEENENYKAVREILYQLGCDSEKWGTPEWNPLKKFVKKGQTVVIKPNLVFHEHPLGDKEMLSMITNAAVIRPIIDYILLATNGNVKIIIGDAPVQGGDFHQALRISGIKELVKFYKEKNIRIQLIDFRLLISARTPNGVLSEKKANPDRSLKLYTIIDLKEKSELMEVISKSNRFEITDYGFGSVRKHHNKEKNEYIIPNEILQADLFINVPKLKTHRKAGLTCAMKNLVGINGDKTCLAHHTKGIKKYGGDEFDRFELKTLLRTRIWAFLKSNKIGIYVASLIKRFFEKVVWKGKSLKEHNMLQKPSVFSEGSWYGNDTIWRCVKDLNKILLYSDKKGSMCKQQQRHYLCIVDAVLAGEGEGPMEQRTKEFGVLFGGFNPVYVDYCASRLMRYSYRYIPTVRQGFKNKWWPLVEKDPKNIIFHTNTKEDISAYFLPTFGWQKRLKEEKL